MIKFMERMPNWYWAMMNGVLAFLVVLILAGAVGWPNPVALAIGFGLGSGVARYRRGKQ